jgi:fructoselysine 6-phosphate deglycase
MEVKEIIQDIQKSRIGKGELKHVFFVACGGSQAAIYPGHYLLKCESRGFTTSIWNSGEFITATPKALDENSICIICSLNATRETVEAVKTAKANGAVAIAMTGFPDTQMAKEGEYVVVYSNGDEQVYSESNQSNSLRLGFEILKQYEDYENYEAAMEAYKAIDGIIAEAKASFLPDAQVFADTYKDDGILYILASGSLYGTAYSMASCHLMEMQTKHAVILHSGEYFHGPFETTDDKLAMVLFKGSGKTRPLDERVEKFIGKYNSHHKIFDILEFTRGKLDARVSEYFDSVIMIPMERFYVYQMSLKTGRSFDYRKYMWKVEY